MINKKLIITSTVAFVLGALITILVFNLMGTEQTISIPIAKDNIAHNNKITESEITYIEITLAQAKKLNIITDIDEIVGMYISSNNMVPKNSFFYSGNLNSEKPNIGFENIEEDSIIFSLTLDQNTDYIKNLKIGDKIDLYIEYTSDANIPSYTKYLSDISVVSISDSNLQETNDINNASIILFELSNDIYTSLNSAAQIENINIIPVSKDSVYETTKTESSIDEINNYLN